MKVMFVAMGGGGQALDVAQLLNVLVPKMEVLFVGPKGFEFKDILSLQVRFLPKKYPFLWKLELVSHILKSRPQILHVYWPGFGWTTVFVFLLCRLLGIKTVWTAPNVVAHERRFILTVYFRAVYKFVDRIIVYSQQNKNMMLREFRVDREKIKIVPYGNLIILDQGRYTKEEARKVLGIKSKHVIGHIGLVRPYKGINILYDVFKGMNQDVCLLMVGPWFTATELLMEMQSDKRVKLINRYIPEKEIEMYFRACDVIVAPYIHFEGYSSLIVAAFGFGIPVVATNVGSLPDLVEDGVTGRLVNPDVGGVKRGLEDLLNNPEKQKEMSKNARHIVESRLSWKKIEEKVLEIYGELLS